MKSLEIVNEKIDYIEISKSNIKEVSPYYYEKVLLEQLKELEQIKQDLEVLEIIRKIFDKARFRFYDKVAEADILLEDNDICIEAVDRLTKLKVADVKKLKQWLEVNENEND